MFNHDRSAPELTKHEWLTPPDLIAKLGTFDLDPCAPVPERRPWPTAAEHYDITHNGLQRPWHGRVWCNPPYSNDKAFVRKAAEEAALGFTTVMLVYAKTDVAWWHDYVMRFADEVRLVRGRVGFLRPGGGAAVGAPKGSAVVVFRPKLRPSTPTFSTISFPKP